MYDFAHALSDAIEGITHSLCTLEFEDHRPLYDWVVAKCPEVGTTPGSSGVCARPGKQYRADPATPTPIDGEPPLKPPRQIEFSRLNVAHTVMSKRKLAKLVDDRLVNGWDDPRLPTLALIRSRFCGAEGLQKGRASRCVEGVRGARRRVQGRRVHRERGAGRLCARCARRVGSEGVRGVKAFTINRRRLDGS